MEDARIETTETYVPGPCSSATPINPLLPSLVKVNSQINERLEQCEERPANCKYIRIGCQWKGSIHKAHEHEQVCAYPKMSGAELMSTLQARDMDFEQEKKFCTTLIDLLSYEKIVFNKLQLEPYRTDENVPNVLFYETAEFTSLKHQWVVKARINNSHRDPHQSCACEIIYQLILKTKISRPLKIQYCALKGSLSDMKLNTKIYRHDFTDTEKMSYFNLLPLPENSECMLASKVINFRLIMALL